MSIDSATDAVKEEHVQVEETDDSCSFQFFEIVPVTRDTDGSSTTECVSGDWSAEVKEENVTVVKQEPMSLTALMHWSHHQVMRLTSACPLPSNRHHWRHGDCLEGKREKYQVGSVQYSVRQLCTVHCAHI